MTWIIPYTYFSIFYVYYEQYATIVTDAIIQLSLSLTAICIVTTVLLDLYSALLLLFIITCILINLIGLMYWWWIDFNAISVVNLVMVSWNIFLQQIIIFYQGSRHFCWILFTSIASICIQQSIDTLFTSTRCIINSWIIGEYQLRIMSIIELIIGIQRYNIDKICRHYCASICIFTNTQCILFSYVFWYCCNWCNTWTHSSARCIKFYR